MFHITRIDWLLNEMYISCAQGQIADAISEIPVPVLIENPLRFRPSSGRA